MDGRIKERDQFLVEKIIGEVYPTDDSEYARLTRMKYSMMFVSWAGFGMVWTGAKRKEWFEELLNAIVMMIHVPGPMRLKLYYEWEKKEPHERIEFIYQFCKENRKE